MDAWFGTVAGPCWTAPQRLKRGEERCRVDAQLQQTVIGEVRCFMVTICVDDHGWRWETWYQFNLACTF